MISRAELCNFLDVALDLDHAGLVWCPELGDEVAEKPNLERISIVKEYNPALVRSLRSNYLWLPNIEQLVAQLAARDGILIHAGFELSEKVLGYTVIVNVHGQEFKHGADSLRTAMASCLCQVLSAGGQCQLQ